MKRAIPMFLVLSCAIATCAVAWAQMQSTTAIFGTIKDVSGAVLPGVNVTVRNEETGAVRETITNELGYYSVQSLKPGRYSITASLTGFKTAVVRDREVLVSIPATVSFSMELGDLAQEVTVSAEGAELLEPGRTGERLAQHQQHPRVPHDVERAGDRAGVLGPVGAQGHEVVSFSTVGGRIWLA